jgi:trk system potassium uptake protein
MQGNDNPRFRFLQAAQLSGSAILSLLGQQVVHMPEGYFGLAQGVTPFGIGYVIVLVLAGGFLIAGTLRGRSWAHKLRPVFYSVNLGMFVPALVTDTLMAGMLVGWHLLLVLRHLLPTRDSGERMALLGQEEHWPRLEYWLDRTGPAIRHLLVIAILITVSVVGFEMQAGLFVYTVCVAVNLVVVAFCSPLAILMFRTGRRWVALLALPLLALPLVMKGPAAILTILVITETSFLLVLVSQGVLFREILNHFYRSPAALGLITFGGTIALGTLLLSFPVASASGESISLLDAFFTSTSATCVTGLIVLDTPNAFSGFGLGVILGLIQVGGLGIMVLSTFATLLLGKKLGLRGEQALSQLLDSRGTREAYRLTLFIVASTLVIEAIGALGLASCFHRHGFAALDSVWRGCFHSVSAFCNAGFSLQTDSLTVFKEDPFALGVFALLITLGGLGFLVLAGAWSWARLRRRPAMWFQIKIVLWMSLALVLIGSFVIAWSEWDASLRSLSMSDKLTNAVFQSITLRTAGFNSVDLGSIRSATGLVMMVWMFIGASPGSTGGGIKTTTFLVLLAAIRAISRGESRLILFRKEVPQAVLYRSAAITAVSLGIAFAGLFALLASQSGTFHSLAFETFSALGTVGLSLGATPLLDPLGKLVVIVLMFAGRMGPLSLALLLGRDRTSRIGYSKARVMVG